MKRSSNAHLTEKCIRVFNFLKLREIDTRLRDIPVAAAPVEQ